MKSKFLDSTLALAFFSALLFTIGHAYDVAYLSRLHLPLNEYLPPSYLEIARPFDIVFVVLHSDYQYFLAFSALIAVVYVVLALWPRFRRWLASIATFLRRIPLAAYLLMAAFGFIALSNWITKFGWTQASRCIDIANYTDWVITLKDYQNVRCRLAAASSDCCYVVVLRSGPNTIVQTIPKDSVSKIEYDPTIY